MKALIVEVSFPDEMMDLALASGHLTPSLLAAEIRKMPVVVPKFYISHLKPYYKDIIRQQLGSINHIDWEILEDGARFSV